MVTQAGRWGAGCSAEPDNQQRQNLLMNQKTTLAAICKMRWLSAWMAFSAPKPSRPPPPSCGGRFFTVPAESKRIALVTPPHSVWLNALNASRRSWIRLFPDGDVLIEAHIPLIDTRAGDVVVAGVYPHAALGRGREAGGVNEFVDVPVRTGKVGIARHHRARRQVFAAGNHAVQLRRAGHRAAGRLREQRQTPDDETRG